VKSMKRELRPLAALVMVALIGAGCGSGSAENGSTGTGGSSRADTNATSQDRSVQFAECMRKNGVTAFPDPDASESDQELVEAIERLDQSSATWKKAIGACRDLQPPGLLGGKATPQEMKQRLAFAQCIRDNGVKDFPDPANGEPLVDTNRIPSTDRAGGMTILNAAMQKCGDALAGALGDR
jgi:hypothetical protein